MTQAILFPFLYCLLLGSAWAIFFKKKFADSLAPAIMLHIIIVMLSGMLLHKLSVGIWGGMMLFAGALAYKIWKSPQDARTFLQSALPGGVFIFVVFYIFCFIVNDGKRLIYLDDYAHWGVFVKESLRLDKLYAESPLQFWHKDYVPATTLFEVIWCRLSGRFLEADLFRALQMFGFAMMLPLVSSFSGENKGQQRFLWSVYQLGAAFLFIVLLQLLFVDWGFNFYRSIFADNALGVVFFYCFVEAYRDYRGEENYQALVLALGCATLVLVKQMGIALLPMAIAFYVVKRFFFSSGSCGRKDWMQALAMLMVPLFLWRGFGMFVAKFSDGFVSAFTSKQGYDTVNMPLIFGLFGRASESPIRHLAAFRNKFLEALLRQEIFYVTASSYTVVVVCATAAVFAILWCSGKIGNEKEAQRKIALAGLFVLLSGITYAVLIYVAYAVAFPPDRALVLGSYPRYMGMFSMILLLVVAFVYSESKLWIKHGALCILIIVYCGVYVFLGSVPVSDKMLSTKDAKIMGAYEVFAERFAKQVPQDSSILFSDSFLKATNPGYPFHAMRFYTHPRNIALLGDLLWKINTENKDKKAELNLLKKAVNGYGYLFINNLGHRGYLEKYSAIFKNPSQLESMTLYKVRSRGEEAVQLEKIAYMNTALQNIDRWTALTYAALKGNLSLARTLIATGAKVNLHDKNPGWTPLMHAAFHGHEDIVKLLLEHKANINAFSAKGATPLMLAASKGREGVVRVLLEKGADITLRDRAGATALQRAVQAGHTRIEAMLREAQGWTELTYASWNGRLDDVRALVAKGADVNLHDKEPGWTPLMHAAFHGHADIVKLLLEKGANAKATEKNGMSALQLAEKNGHTDIANMLRAAMMLQ